MTEQEWRDRFGFILRDIIDSKGCTRREFAEEIGSSEKSLDHYIHGRRTPNVKFLTNLALTLGYSVDKFINFGEKIDR